VNFPAVMVWMPRLRAALTPSDSAGRYRGLGVDVFFGEARFTDPDTDDLGGDAGPGGRCRSAHPGVDHHHPYPT
jgi:hypothetical protein